jgi:hypothetical protein
MIEDQPERPETTFKRHFKIIMLVLIVLGSLSGGYATSPIIVSKPEQILEEILHCIAFAIPVIPSVITGVWLVLSVYRIRKFFSDRDATHFIDTSALLRHALCFASYLFATLAYSCSFFYCMFDLYSVEAATFYLYTEGITQIVITLSYLLLLQIFWVLGTKLKQEEFKDANQLDQPVLSEPVVQEFDEEAETMALIWNQIVRDATPNSQKFKMTESVSVSSSQLVRTLQKSNQNEQTQSRVSADDVEKNELL